MSRILCAVAIGTIGLFSFASSLRAATPATTTTENTTQTTTNHHAPTMRPWRASETIGLKVENPQGQSLGKIEDLVFNPTNGHVRYAVLSFGGVLGVGDKYFAIPWSHFRPEEKAGRSGSERFVMVLDIDENRLKTAPGFDSKNWPEFGDSAYGTSVDQFYGHNTSAHRSTTTNTK